MFAEVLVNHSYSRIKNRLSYQVPANLVLKEGDLVKVPFQNKLKEGIVLKLNSKVPDFDTKYIEGTLSSNIFLKDWQIKLANWMSDYYFCSIFDIYKAFLPKKIWSGKKIELKDQTKKNLKSEDLTLTKDQEKIVTEIIKSDKKYFLIYAITGAGKTEMYKKIIQNAIRNQKQALILVPEISLTPQLVKYFENSFKNISVINSRISEKKRAEEWKKIYEGKAELIIGSRSALFYPFKDLGLIIIDEEHEYSYKQEQNPKYNTRDVAKKISELTDSKLIFGSATPSIETMYLAKNGEYELHELGERINQTPLPNVEIVDMREELKKKNYTIFSEELEQKIRSNLDRKEQTILFLNRRGSASSTLCRDCGYTMVCKNCETKLTYHSSNYSFKTLICHHCGISIKMPAYCPNCNSIRIKQIGIGTEKVEEEVKKLFPQAQVARADKDTMTKKDSYHKLHQDLIDQNIDILIGTQMIGKGFDIANLSLVGVILADMGLHIPDFRASERSFQLLTQVAGRAGRREKQGEVIIQTYSPEHISVKLSKEHDYNSFYEQEIYSREQMNLPPFSKLIKLSYQNEKKESCVKESEILISKLKDGNHEIFSAPAFISKLKNKFQWNVLIQGPDPASLIKKLEQEDFKNWKIDVDPIHTV